MGDKIRKILCAYERGHLQVQRIRKMSLKVSSFSGQNNEGKKQTSCKVTMSERGNFSESRRNLGFTI
jgi:hypothetical protein